MHAESAALYMSVMLQRFIGPLRLSRYKAALKDLQFKEVPLMGGDYYFDRQCQQHGGEPTPSCLDHACDMVSVKISLAFAVEVPIQCAEVPIQ